MTKSCDFAVEKCKHADIGCPEKNIRKRIREHEEDDATHLPLLMNAVKKMREEKNTASGSGKTFKMTNYTELKQNNSGFVSEPFFSHPNGFKVQLVVWPNGVSSVRNEYMLVAVKLLEGPYDTDLSWPFVGQTTVTLLNQQGDANHHGEDGTQEVYERNQITAPNKPIYFSSKFIPHKELEGRNSPRSYDSSDDSSDDESEDECYLLNDTLYFRVNIQTTEYKQWLNVNLTP